MLRAAFDRKNFHKKLDRNSEVAARLKWSDDHVVVVDFEGQIEPHPLDEG
jgi:hypothetical protein